MSGERIVIVGAGPAGLSGARSYRRHGGRLPVVMVGDDPDPPYERPALSKELLRGEAGREALALEPPSFYAEHEIELRTGSRAVSLDLDARSVTTSDGEELPFAGLLLATGSRAAVPPLAGADLPAVATLRWIDDSERLGAAAAAGARILVAGSGFVGCEAAISLARRGAEVTLATMEEAPQEERLGPEVGERIAGWIREAGVELITGVELGGLEPAGAGAAAALGGRRIEADVVLLALGARRNGELAAAAGLELDRDAIPVDELMRSAADGVLAAGDVAVAHNPAAGRPLRVEHWGEALRQGEVAGATLAGSGGERWARAPGFWSGLGERTLKHVAWGDGWDRVELTDHPGGGFTARYVRDGELAGVLTHDADEDYERGRELVEARASWA